MSNEVNELRQMLATASRNPNGWSVMTTGTLHDLHVLVESMTDRLEELEAAAAGLMLTVRVNLTRQQTAAMPGLDKALERVHHFMFGDSNG